MFDRPINYSIYLLAKVIEGLNVAVFKLVDWRDQEEGLEEDEVPEIKLDEVDDPDNTQITMREIDLGDLQIECPECGDLDYIFLVGLGVSQYDGDDNEGDTFEISTVGMVAYTCGCIVFSSCLTDKVGAILNASDNRMLTIDLVNTISKCEEHGVMHTEE